MAEIKNEEMVEVKEAEQQVTENQNDKNALNFAPIDVIQMEPMEAPSMSVGKLVLTVSTTVASAYALYKIGTKVSYAGRKFIRKKIREHKERKEAAIRAMEEQAYDGEDAVCDVEAQDPEDTK